MSLTQSNPNTDPSIAPEFAIKQMGQALVIDDHQLLLFKTPEEIGRRKHDCIATDNPAVFSRLVKGGLDTLNDGDSVTFEVTNSSWPGHYDIPRTVTRHGDQFSIEDDRPPQELKVVETETADEEAITGLNKDEIEKFADGLSINQRYLSYMREMVDRGDRLGNYFASLGFTADGSTFPLPRSLEENIDQARSAGVDVPPIKVLDMGVVSGGLYVDTWEEGALPVSNRVEWFGHDGAQDHFRGLQVFGSEAMFLGQLYAHTAKTSESIDGRVYPTPYEINRGADAQKDEIPMKGEDKINHAGEVLDRFTAQLDRMVGYGMIDELPSSEKLILPKHLDYIDEMVAVILASPDAAQKFIEYLQSVGSKALVDGVFNRETYERELFERRQKYWGITPIVPEPKQETYSDDFIWA